MSLSRRPGNARAHHGTAQRGTAMGRYGVPSRAPRRWRGGAMGTSRPTATGPYAMAHGDGGARGRGVAARARAVRTATGREG